MYGWCVAKCVAGLIFWSKNFCRLLKLNELNCKNRTVRHGAEVTFEPGHDYRATPTELAALRMIALHECMKSFGPFVQVSSLLVGKADVTRPQHYKGPLVMIAGLEGTMRALVSEEFQALAAPAAKRHILPWYEMARKRQSLV